MRVRHLGGKVLRGLGRLWTSAGHVLDPPGLILLYHRVAHPDIDPWGISVRPERFAEHLEVLRRVARPVPLNQVAQGKGKRVAIAFDDGYADNLQAALPLLERSDVPATVFVASGYVGQPRPFWWDELGYLLLRPRTLPSELQLKFAGTSQEWTLGEAASRGAFLHNWRAETDADAGPRQRLYLDLYGRLRRADPADREDALSALRKWAGSDNPGEDDTRDSPGRPMTAAELAALAAHPLVEIGAHTVTHPPLADLDPAAQWAEVRESRARLEELTGHPVTSFSFPYGSRGKQSAGLVREAGFLRACTSVNGSVRRSGDPFALPRVSVGDWTAEEFAAVLSPWLT